MRLVSGEASGANRLYEQRPAVSGSIAPLRAAVVELAAASGATEEQRDRIALALSEAVTNCTLHAYGDRGPPGSVAVEAWASEGRLHVVVSDEGHGMRPRISSPGMGLGLSLIARMSEHVDIEHPEGGGVTVRMSFPIAS